MVCVVLTLASTVDEAGTERARTYVYVVDGTREETQGTLRDNRSGNRITDLIMAGSPNAVRGEPPENAHMIFSIYMGVKDSRGLKSTHALSYERHDFAAKYNVSCRKMMDSYGQLQRVLAKAVRARDELKKEKTK